jgi:hypothetical protein
MFKKKFIKRLGYENISSTVEIMENEKSNISHINPGNKNDGCTH